MTGGRDSVCRVWDMRTKVRSCCSRHNAHRCLPFVHQHTATVCPVVHPMCPPTDFAGLSDASLCCTAQVQVHCLSGHDDTVASILTQATDPQVPPLLQHRRHALHSVTFIRGIPAAKPQCKDEQGHTSATLAGCPRPEGGACMAAGHHRLARQDHPALGHQGGSPQDHGDPHLPQEIGQQRSISLTL